MSRRGSVLKTPWASPGWRSANCSRLGLGDPMPSKSMPVNLDLPQLDPRLPVWVGGASYQHGTGAIGVDGKLALGINTQDPHTKSHRDTQPIETRI